MGGAAKLGKHTFFQCTKVIKSKSSSEKKNILQNICRPLKTLSEDLVRCSLCEGEVPQPWRIGTEGPGQDRISAHHPCLGSRLPAGINSLPIKHFPSAPFPLFQKRLSSMWVCSSPRENLNCGNERTKAICPRSSQETSWLLFKNADRSSVQQRAGHELILYIQPHSKGHTVGKEMECGSERESHLG